MFEQNLPADLAWFAEDLLPQVTQENFNIDSLQFDSAPTSCSASPPIQELPLEEALAELDRCLAAPATFELVSFLRKTRKILPSDAIPYEPLNGTVSAERVTLLLSSLRVHIKSGVVPEKIQIYDDPQSPLCLELTACELLGPSYYKVVERDKAKLKLRVVKLPTRGGTSRCMVALLDKDSAPLSPPQSFKLRSLHTFKENRRKQLRKVSGEESVPPSKKQRKASIELD